MPVIWSGYYHQTYRRKMPFRRSDKSWWVDYPSSFRHYLRICSETQLKQYGGPRLAVWWCTCRPFCSVRQQNSTRPTIKAVTSSPNFPKFLNMTSEQNPALGTNHLLRPGALVLANVRYKQIFYVVTTNSIIPFTAAPIVVVKQKPLPYLPVSCDLCQNRQKVCRMSSILSCDACYSDQVPCTVAAQPLA